MIWKPDQGLKTNTFQWPINAADDISSSAHPAKMLPKGI